ncbi:MAG: hypothetical protein GX628_00520 [Clostridiales bacterium]|nr:hypothetical protein [Clostridiales bacterium]
MKCKSVKDLLFEYIDGALSESERAHIEEHLAGCAECRAELELCRKTLSAISDTRGIDFASGSIVSSVMKRIADEGITPDSEKDAVIVTDRRSRLSRILRPAGTVVAAVLVVATVFAVREPLMKIIGITGGAAEAADIDLSRYDNIYVELTTGDPAAGAIPDEEYAYGGENGVAPSAYAASGYRQFSAAAALEAADEAAPEAVQGGGSDTADNPVEDHAETAALANEKSAEDAGDERADKPPLAMKAPAVTTDDRKAPPAVTTEGKKEPPAVTTEGQKEPPAVTTGEQKEPPAVTTEEQKEPPAVTTEEKKEPPAVTTEEQKEPPAVTTEEQKEPPAVTTGEQKEPPAVTTEEKKAPPAVTTGEQKEPPAVTTEGQKEPPAVTTEDGGKKPSDKKPGEAMLEDPLSYFKDFGELGDITAGLKAVYTCILPAGSDIGAIVPKSAFIRDTKKLTLVVIPLTERVTDGMLEPFGKLTLAAEPGGDKFVGIIIIPGG